MQPLFIFVKQIKRNSYYKKNILLILFDLHVQLNKHSLTTKLSIPET